MRPRSSEKNAWLLSPPSIVLLLRRPEIPRKLIPGVGADRNFVAALQMVNEQLDKQIGKGRKRAQWSVDEFAEGIAILEPILNTLTKQLKKLQDVTK